MNFRKNNSIITHEFGNWFYYPDHGRFQHNKQGEFFLEKRLSKILNLFLQHKDQIVKRSDVMNNVWEDVRVTDENVTKGIFDLRKILRDKEIDAIQIATIRNIGYRMELQEKASKQRFLFRFLLKSAMYLILFLSFAILLIRAVRYEN